MTRRQISDTSDSRVTLVAKVKSVGFYQAVHTTHVTGQQPTHEQDSLGDSDDGLAHFLQQCTLFLAGAGLHRSRHGRFLVIPSRGHCDGVEVKPESNPQNKEIQNPNSND
jgi:hypothetical protein